MEINGPYIVEEFEFIRDVNNSDRGIFVAITAGGVRFGMPMTVGELKARLDRMQRELSDL